MTDLVRLMDVANSSARHYRLRWTKPVNRGMTVFWVIVWLVLAFGSHKTNWTLMIVLWVGGFGSV